MEPNNRTTHTVTEFLITGLDEVQHPKLVGAAILFVLFLILIGSITNICVIAFNKPLHTPMYFFICSLAVVDIVYTSGISVTMLNVLLGEERRVPYAPCMIHFCEYAALVRAACVNPTFYFSLASTVATTILWVNLALIFFSYMKIVYVVIQMSSSKDRRKTFNTCVSHMIVVACFFIPKVLLILVTRVGLVLTLSHRNGLIIGSTLGPSLVNPLVMFGMIWTNVHDNVSLATSHSH
ncbi:olfactory receptor 5P3-like [Oncorhynchus tshawytscha]|uniref:olfactory receptor 5P3-like n=1 Tax=Oncorhynchus tshawytscha TaxID=74940 RepID=UPI001C3D8D16|nr:olfactory receptor 5P3-like [Oncorhynchus tshawytscha]